VLAEGVQTWVHHLLLQVCLVAATAVCFLWILCYRCDSCWLLVWQPHSPCAATPIHLRCRCSGQCTRPVPHLRLLLHLAQLTLVRTAYFATVNATWGLGKVTYQNGDR